MQTKRSERYKIYLLNAHKVIPSKWSKHLKRSGKQTIILASATCMIAAYTVALTGCKSSTKPPKYTAEQWQHMKHKGRSSGSR